MTPAPTIATRRTWSGPSAATCSSSHLRLGQPTGHDFPQPPGVPGEIVVGAVDLDIPAWLPRLRVQPAGLLSGNPPVLGAVNDQQRARRDRPYGVKRVQPCDYLVPLADELRRGGGEETGELMFDPAGVKVERAEVGCCPEDGHRPQPRVGSRSQHRGPAAETVPRYGQPDRVNTGIPAVSQMVDRGGDVPPG